MGTEYVKDFDESEYASALAELVINSKPIINNLTIIAGENKEAGYQIVRLIESRIQSVGVGQVLPTMYLLDSIMKNIGEPFVGLFNKNIGVLFVNTFQRADEATRASLLHLFRTWNGLLPQEKLYEIEQHMRSIDDALVSGRRTLNNRYPNAPPTSQQQPPPPPSSYPSHSQQQLQSYQQQQQQQQLQQQMYINPRYFETLNGQPSVGNAPRGRGNNVAPMNSSQRGGNTQALGNPGWGSRVEPPVDPRTSYGRGRHRGGGGNMPRGFIRNPVPPSQSQIATPPVPQNPLPMPTHPDQLSQQAVLSILSPQVIQQLQQLQQQIVNGFTPTIEQQRLIEELQPILGSIAPQLSSNLPPEVPFGSIPEHSLLPPIGDGAQLMHMMAPQPAPFVPSNFAPTPAMPIAPIVPDVGVIGGTSLGLGGPVAMPTQQLQIQTPLTGMPSTSSLPSVSPALSAPALPTSQVPLANATGISTGASSAAPSHPKRRSLKPDDLKQRDEEGIESLYHLGKSRKCPTCGIRYLDHEKYGKHLDWHFRMNRKEKQKLKKAMSKSWFLSVEEWAKFEGDEAAEQPATPFFPSQNENNQGEKEEKEQDDVPCVPAEEDNKSCAICNEQFEQFWDNESEEWMFKGAIKVGSLLYHSNCYSVNTSRSSDSIPGLSNGVDDTPYPTNSLKRDANSLENEQATKRIKKEGDTL
eukprot:TRINITY_DN788_c0_g5_i1.p1 TRINITY_DN788_c0_g5~~TRINITY_DN788_c0_g5_i1.p1  ORF type:complete len:694 (-),score=137.34 TRINITY_DN788_c0_g5_i1:31-2112(-)